MTEVEKFYFCNLLFYLTFTLLLCVVCIHSDVSLNFSIYGQGFQGTGLWKFRYSRQYRGSEWGGGGGGPHVGCRLKFHYFVGCL